MLDLAATRRPFPRVVITSNAVLQLDPAHSTPHVQTTL